MSKLHLTFACGPYDRTLALRDGSVQPEGIDLNYIASQPPDIFWRMLQFKEFEISEMSLSNHATLVSTGDAPFIAIPVFPSRVFRHGKSRPFFPYQSSNRRRNHWRLAGTGRGGDFFTVATIIFWRR